jgi:hypothetical protein
MITLSIINAILAIGLLIHSIENSQPKLLILLETIVIISSVIVIINYSMGPKPKLIESPVTTMQDSIYRAGYRKGLIDCKENQSN